MCLVHGMYMVAIVKMKTQWDNYACLCLLENGKRSSEEEKSSKESIEDASGEEGQGKAVKERKKKGKFDKTEGKVVYDKVS